MGYYCAKCDEYFSSPYYCIHRYNSEAPVLNGESMPDYDVPIPYASKQLAEAKGVRMPTLKERLALNVNDAEDRLRDAKRAKEILDKNPDLEELLNIMQKGRF